MWNFTRKRQSAGNICLVLFTAFLFTILVAPFAMVENAEASQQTKDGKELTTIQGTPGNFTQGGTTSTITGTASGYQLLVKLAADPLSTFETLRVDFVNGNGTVKIVYGNNDLNDTVATATYLGPSVYGAVYSLAYLAPSDFYLSANNIVYGKVYVGSTFYELIVFTLTLQPPETSSNGPGGGITPSEPKTNTDTGTIVVDPDKGSATVTVDTDKVKDLINNNKPVIIETVPANAKATDIKVTLAASIITTLADKSKDLTIKTDDVQFVIPPGALDVQALAEVLKNDPNAKITLNVTEATKTVDTTGNENVQLVGPVYNFTIVAKSSSGETTISTFAQEFEVTIPYNESDLNGIPEDKLGAYRVKVNEVEFLGGEVDKVNKVVKFKTKSFSEYTLGAKIAAFPDIVKHWAKNDIDLLAERGIVKGISSSSFAPDATITRAQFATLLVKALGLKEVKPAKATFKDVKSGSWYYGTVETAAANGLITGYNGSFEPDGKITRQAMAVMVARALKVGGKSVSADAAQLNKFSDKQQIASWAKNGVAAAVKEGIITGRTTSTFVPTANATRAEGTVMIKKVLGSLGKL